MMVKRTRRETQVYIMVYPEVVREDSRYGMPFNCKWMLGMYGAGSKKNLHR